MSLGAPLLDTADQRTNLASETIRGVELSYRSRGEAGQTPVVFLHGFTGNVRNFSFNFSAVAEAGYRVLAADHPGHGRSSAPDDPALYAMDAMADLHHRLQRKLDFVPAVLVGHSMGAAVAEEYAIAWPDDVRALVLVDSAGGSYKPSWNKTLDQYAADEPRRVAFEQGMEALFDYQVEQGWRSVDHLPEQIRALARSEFARTSAVGYFHACTALRNRTSTLERLAGFDKPTLIVHGENEERGFVRGCQELHEAIPGSRLEVVAGAGHSPTFEAPDAFNRLLIEFLDRL